MNGLAAGAVLLLGDETHFRSNDTLPCVVHLGHRLAVPGSAHNGLFTLPLQ